jgi:phosphoribosylformimino-5-aminoimidazole carboxamide ribotide isomerase
MHIIPAIDIIDGKCVRLTQGDYEQQKVYNEDPLEVAKAFADQGVTPAAPGRPGWSQGEAHCQLPGAGAAWLAALTLHIDFGGGLKRDEDLRIAFEAGAAQVTGGTVAVKAPQRFLRWLETYGPERIILGADVKNGRVAVSGWQEESQEELLPFLERYLAAGVRYVICTEVSRDGLLQGSAVELYTQIRHRFPDLQLIASGGVTQLSEIDALAELGCFGAIIGKAIYEGHIRLEDLKL